MAKLSEMILGETARNLNLIDRPATLLRRGEVNRQQDLAAESNLKTAKQGRTLATRADARADALADLEARRVAVGEKGLGLEERRVATGEAGVELAKSGQALTARQVAVGESAEERAKARDIILNDNAKLLGDSQRNKLFVEGTEIAQKYVAPTAMQMVELNKEAMKTQDPALKADLFLQRDKLAREFAKEGALKTYIGMTPQFHELSGLTEFHLFNTQQTDIEKEQEMQKMLLGLERSNQVYIGWKQRMSQEAAAYALALKVDSTKQASFAEAQGKASGEIIGTAEAYTEVSNRGLELPPEELSEGQKARVQNTYGDYVSNNVLKEFGKNARWLKFSKDMDKKGEIGSAIGGMPEAMFNHDAPIFENVVKNILSEGYKGKSTTEFRAYLDAMIGTDPGQIPPESPFATALGKLKKEYIGELRTAKVKLPTSIVGQ